MHSNSKIIKFKNTKVKNKIKRVKHIKNDDNNFGIIKIDLRVF